MNTSAMSETRRLRQRIATLETTLAEQTRRTEALRREIALFEAFFDASPGILNITDAKFNYLKTDPLTPTYFGTDRQRIVGKSVKTLAPAFYRRYAAMMRQVTETGKPVMNVAVEAPVSARPGEVARWRASYFPVRLPGGKRGLGVVGVEITDMCRAAEAALQESEGRYRGLFAQSADAIVVFDPKTLAILDFNDEACRRLGYSRREFAELKISDIDVVESAASVRRHAKRVILNDVAVFETKQRTKRGVLLDIEVRSKAIRLGGEVVIQGCWRDITDRKKIEVELLHARENLEAKVMERTAQLQALTSELIRVEQAEREQIGQVIHDDLQQLLVAAQCHIAAMPQAGADAQHTASVLRILGILDKAIQVARVLTHDLMPLVYRGQTLASGLKGLAHDMRENFGFAVGIKLDAKARLVSHTVRTFAVNAVRELLFNVIKHAGTHKAQLTLKRLGTGRIIIVVADKGRGFKATPGHYGTGLSRIRDRAEVFGGELRLISRPGGGTQARLILPNG